MKSTVAWGTCILLGAIEPGSPPVSLNVVVDAAEPGVVELWILDGAVDVSAPLALAATLPSGAFGPNGIALVTMDELTLPDDLTTGEISTGTVGVVACAEAVELTPADTTLGLCPGFAPVPASLATAPFDPNGTIPPTFPAGTAPPG